MPAARRPVAPGLMLSGLVRNLGAPTAVAFLVFALTILSLLENVAPQPTPGLWLPIGLAMGALMAQGRTSPVAIILANTVGGAAAFLSRPEWGASHATVIVLGQTLALIVSAYLAPRHNRRSTDVDESGSSAPPSPWLVTSLIIASPSVSATIAAISSVVAERMGALPSFYSHYAWALSNLLGIAAIGPAVAFALHPGAWQRPSYPWVPHWAVIGLLGLLTSLSGFAAAEGFSSFSLITISLPLLAIPMILCAIMAAASPAAPLAIAIALFAIFATLGAEAISTSSGFQIYIYFVVVFGHVLGLLFRHATQVVDLALTDTAHLQRRLALAGEDIERERNAVSAERARVNTLEARLTTLRRVGALAIGTFDSTGRAVELGGWERLTGQKASEAVGMGWLNAIHPDNRDGVARAWRTCIETSVPFRASYRLVDEDGLERQVLDRRTLIPGKPNQWICLLIDHEDEADQNATGLRQDTLAAVLDGASIAIWEQLDDADAQRWSKQSFLLLGHIPASNGKASGSMLLRRIHPADRDKFAEALAHARRTGTTFKAEFRILRADTGEERFFETTAVPVDWPLSNRYSGVLMDVTAAKTAMAAQHTLTREANHRAKNALQTVQAVIRLALSEGEGDLTAVAGRVDALAGAYQVLAAERWDGASLRHAVEAALAPLAGLGRFEVLGPYISLSPEAAGATALILYEIGANSVGSGPGITAAAVTWEEAVAGGYTLTWREAPSSDRSPLSTSGEGQLIASLALQQLRGTIEPLADGDRGWLLHIPPSAIQAHRPIPTRTPTRLSPPRSPKIAPGSNEKIARPWRIMIVEDELLLATEAARTLRGQGYEILGPVTTIEEAMSLAETAEFDAAILDVDLGGDRIYPAAAALARRGIPFLYATGHEEYEEDAASPAARRLTKPFSLKALSAAVSELLSEHQ